MNEEELARKLRGEALAEECDPEFYDPRCEPDHAQQDNRE